MAWQVARIVVDSMQADWQRGPIAFSR